MIVLTCLDKWDDWTCRPIGTVVCDYLVPSGTGGTSNVRFPTPDIGRRATASQDSGLWSSQPPLARRQRYATAAHGRRAGQAGRQTSDVGRLISDARRRTPDIGSLLLLGPIRYLWEKHIASLQLDEEGFRIGGIFEAPLVDDQNAVVDIVKGIEVVFGGRFGEVQRCVVLPTPAIDGTPGA